MSQRDGTSWLTSAGGDIAINATGVTKKFTSIVHEPGFGNALRSFFAPRRQAVTAVDDLSFTVRRGELVALLGPNGAGKSTTIKMLAGIVVPTAGTVEVCGRIPCRDREGNARNVGAVFGQRTQLWWDLPARDSFAILRDMFGVGRDAYHRQLRELDDLLGLSEFWATRTRNLSLGQRVRCDLAAALLHDPSVLILDEPTIGMDVLVKEQVRDFLLHHVNRRGRTVLLTTHDMTEVDRLSERVVLINHGRLVFDGPLERLRGQFGGDWQVRVTIADDDITDQRLDGVSVLRRDGRRVVFGPAPGSVLTPYEALRRIVRRWSVTDVSVEEEDLEAVMRAVYRQQRDDDRVGEPGKIAHRA